MSDVQLTPEDERHAKAVAAVLMTYIDRIIRGLVAKKGMTEVQATRIATAACGRLFMSGRTAEEKLVSGEWEPEVHPPTPDHLPEDL